MVSSRGMLVKRESTSKLTLAPPPQNLGSCSTIFSVKASKSFTMHALLTKDYKTGTRNFTNLLVRVLIADKTSQNGRRL